MLADKIENLTAKISHPNDRLDKKYQHITTLKKRLSAVEADNDWLEQYSRRSNLRFNGMEETSKEDTTAKVVTFVNDTIALSPPIMTSSPATDLGLSPSLGEIVM